MGIHQILNEGMKNFDSNDDESNAIQISQRNILSELSDEIRKTLRYYMDLKYIGKRNWK